LKQTLIDIYHKLFDAIKKRCRLKVILKTVPFFYIFYRLQIAYNSESIIFNSIYNFKFSFFLDRDLGSSGGNQLIMKIQGSKRLNENPR